MKTRSILIGLLTVLSTLTFSADPDKASKINVVVYDIASDQPVAHTAVEIVVDSDCTSGHEMLRSSAVTGDSGEFQTSLPVGAHLLSFTAALGRPVRGCVDIASAQEIKRCGTRLRMSPPFRLQQLFVRTVSGSSKYPPDITSFHPCGQGTTGVCGPLSLPIKVSSKHVVFVDEENRPLANVILEFWFHTMGRGESFGSVTTDSEGGADLWPIYTQQKSKGYHVGGVDVSLNGSSTFLLNLSSTPDERSQRIRVLKWRCGGHEQLQATSD